MPRPNRVHVEGGVYHVYNRLARGEMVFTEEAEARHFLVLLKEVKERDDLTVFGWCLMGNHYHLAVRVGNVPLDRPIRSLQQRVTRGVNARQRVFGPLWQGRYKAKPVLEQRYLDQLLIYIHLNPVTAGLVDDPAAYPWSGHREIIDLRRKGIIDADEVLRLFGKTRRTARASYVRQLRGALEEPWIGETPGYLPWWRLGRPPKGEDEDPEQGHCARVGRDLEGTEERPVLSAEDFVRIGAGVLGITLEELQSRQRQPDVVRAREALAVVGVERYGLRVRDIARVVKKSPDGISKAMARIIRGRQNNLSTLETLNHLDEAITIGL